VTTKQKVESRCATLNATVRVDHNGNLFVTAPSGFHFDLNDTHEMFTGSVESYSKRRDGVDWADILDRMVGETVAPCTAEACPSWDTTHNVCECVTA